MILKRLSRKRVTLQCPVPLWSQILRLEFSNKKKILTGSQIQQTISKTAETVSRVAGITFGPMGRNVLIENETREQPRITKDGVTVVKHLEFEDCFEDAITSLIKNSVNNTNRFAGDGTTTSTIMIAELVRLALKKIASGENIRDIREGLKIARDIGLDFIESVKQRVDSQQALYEIAMVSTNKNEHLSRIISEAIWKTGNVNVQKSTSRDTFLEFSNSIKIVRGIPHPEFKNSGDRIVYNYPLIMACKVPLNSIKEVLPVLELAKKARKQLLIFSQESISDSILSTMIYNKRKNTIESCAIEIPTYGQMQHSKYIDMIAEHTNCYVFDRYSDKNVTEVRFEDLGKAVKVIVDEFETEIVGRAQLTQKSKLSKETLKGSPSNLKEEGPLSATIYAGGSTETLIGENYDKIIDALNSVTLAKDKGVVEGGCITYEKLADLLDSYEGQFQVGVRTFSQALRILRRKLLSNHSADDFLSSSNFREGETEQRRVIDSSQVSKNIIIDSVSLASELIGIQTALVRTRKYNYSKQEYEALSRGSKL